MVTSPDGRTSALRLILRNASYLIGSAVIMQALGLASGMMLTRYLHANGYGNYAFSYIFAWFFMLLLMLGSKGVILRDLPKAPEKAGFYLVQILLLRSFTAIAAIVLTLGIGRWLGKPSEVQAVMALFMLLSATDGLSLTFVDVFRSLEDMRVEVWLYTSERVAVVVALWFATRHQWSLVAIVQMMYGFSLLRTCTWLWPVYRRVSLPAVTFDWPFWGYVCREGWQYLRVDLASAAVQRMDVLLLGILAAAAETGRYNAAYTVFLIASVVPQMVMSALQPTAVRLSGHAPGDTLRLQIDLTRWLLIAMMPMIMILGIAAPTVMARLFGAGFAESGFILRWLMLALPTLLIAGTVANHFFVVDRQIRNFHAICLNAAVNIGLNLWLIPWYGAAGAVVATVVSEAVGLVSVLAFSWQTLGRSLLRVTAPIWAVGLLIYGLTVVSFAHWGLAVLPFGLAGYVAVLWLVGLVRIDDWRNLRGLWRTTT